MSSVKTVSLVVLAVAVIVGSTGCAAYRAPVMPPSAMIITSIKAPLDIDLDKTTLGSKKGTASSVCILGLVAVGDSSIQAAARDGNLTTINHADYEYLSVLWGVFARYATTVYGD